MIAADAVLAAGVHQDGGADDVGLEEDGGVLDAAVHMAFGRKVHDDIGLLLLKNAVNGLAVADVGLAEAEAVLVEDGCQSRKIARIGQLIDADDAVLGVVIHQVKNKVAADKAGAAGDDDGLHGVLLLSYKTSSSGISSSSRFSFPSSLIFVSPASPY